MRASIKRAAVIGVESLIGKQAEVISHSSSDTLAPYQVRIEGEIRRASGPYSLKRREWVVVLAVKGKRLAVKRRDKEAF